MRPIATKDRAGLEEIAATPWRKDFHLLVGCCGEKRLAFGQIRLNVPNADQNDQNRNELQSEADPVEIEEAAPTDVVTDGECGDGRKTGLYCT